ncbi:copper chaperone PCu(A)C [Gordonia sp. zg691]|uniref:copper chaperone PCu(A)C n=1 Tax=Gordonia jinghuaiqii TaxID=2758710 RepID=UPI0016626CEB|nr:copper chaperone PCu(A)C [Gordonia jinghuaiqii]MBD0860885.1 copper chaperone PCu(A)C [Gordonia jinghuaiqii]
MTINRIRTGIAAAIATVLALGALVGCSSDTDEPATSADGVRITEQWVKAAPSGMTAAFGELTNDTDQEIRVVSASSPAAGRVELHEVVASDTGAMTMRPKDGGMAIPANGTSTLRPGGDHLMLFDLPAAITPGQEVTFELTLSDGSTTTFTAQARDFPGADEDYAPGHGGDAPAASTTPQHGA